MESKQHEININTIPVATGESETTIASALPQQTLVISTEPLSRSDTTISEKTQHQSPTSITHQSLKNDNDNDGDHWSPSPISNPVYAQEPPLKQEKQGWIATFLKSLKEGGTKGWLAVLGSFLIHCFVFAPTEFIFGIFEHHYQIVFPGASASSIAFVGTTGSGITYLTGFLSGIVADRFGYRPTAFVGTVIMSVSLVLASFSTAVKILYCFVMFCPRVLCLLCCFFSFLVHFGRGNDYGPGQEKRSRALPSVPKTTATTTTILPLEGSVKPREEGETIGAYALFVVVVHLSKRKQGLCNHNRRKKN